jgi:hypothetical protein
LPGATIPRLPFVLAVAAFPVASSGSALLCLGHHLLDRIEVAARWRRPGGRKAPSRHHELG